VTGEGISDLIDRVSIQVNIMFGINKCLLMLIYHAHQIEMLNPVVHKDGRFNGVILDSRVDQKKGIIATVLVQQGTLRAGDTVVTNACYGKVRLVGIKRDITAVVAEPGDVVEVNAFLTLIIVFFLFDLSRFKKYF
jgi:translation initiation factor IF-2